MLGIKKIQDALIADAIANNPSGLLKTIKTLDTNFDETSLQQFIALSPFLFFQWGGSVPVESERGASESSGNNRERFLAYIGAQSLLDRSDAQKGAYAIVDWFRLRYNGLTLTIESEAITFAVGGINPVPFGAGIAVYLIEVYYFQG